GMPVREGGGRLANATAIGAVHGSMSEPGDGSALDLLLQIDHRIIVLTPEIPVERADFTPCRSCQHLATPAAQSDRDDVAHAMIERHDRCKGFFGYPVDGKPGPVAVQVVHDGQRMNDIAQRRRTDDQCTVHRHKNDSAVRASAESREWRPAAGVEQNLHVKWTPHSDFRPQATILSADAQTPSRATRCPSRCP